MTSKKRTDLSLLKMTTVDLPQVMKFDKKENQPRVDLPLKMIHLMNRKKFVKRNIWKPGRKWLLCIFDEWSTTRWKYTNLIGWISHSKPFIFWIWRILSDRISNPRTKFMFMIILTTFDHFDHSGVFSMSIPMHAICANKPGSVMKISKNNDIQEKSWFIFTENDYCGPSTSYEVW